MSVGGEWHRATQDYLVWKRAAGLSPGTVQMHRHYLMMLSNSVGCGPWTVTERHLVDFLAARRWAAETRKGARSVIRGFYDWAAEHGHVEADPARRLPPVRIPATVPKPCPDDVIAAALARAEPHERLMLLLAATAGLRCVEIAKVHRRDIVERQDGVWLHVVGKGQRGRAIPVESPLADELAAFAGGLSEPMPRRYGRDRVGTGYLFPGQSDGHIHPSHVGKLMRDLLGSGWSAHKLRHRFATVAYAESRDLLAVQQLLGHSKPETTQRYTALPGGALRASAASAATFGTAHRDETVHASGP